MLGKQRSKIQLLAFPVSQWAAGGVKDPSQGPTACLKGHKQPRQISGSNRYKAAFLYVHMMQLKQPKLVFARDHLPLNVKEEQNVKTELLGKEMWKMRA